jgi:hypothetical protein
MNLSQAERNTGPVFTCLGTCTNSAGRGAVRHRFLQPVLTNDIVTNDKPHVMP